MILQYSTKYVIIYKPTTLMDFNTSANTLQYESNVYRMLVK